MTEQGFLEGTGCFLEKDFIIRSFARRGGDERTLNSFDYRFIDFDYRPQPLIFIKQYRWVQ